MADLIDDFPEDDPGTGGHNTGGSHKGTLLVIIIGVLVMLLAPLASWLVVKHTINPRRPGLPPREARASGQETILELNSITVNVYGTRATRVLRIQPHLVLSEPRLAERLRDIMPIISDRINTIAATRTLEQLETVEDREALKRDITNEINAMIRDRFSGTVLEVVFSDFLIQ